jgi:hypothetical protein
MTIARAREFLAAHHRHRPTIQGALWAVGVTQGDQLVGVAIAAWPVAPAQNDGETIEIRRCCTDGTRNAPSFLYRCCVRASRALGFTRVITYSLDSESGASLRGAGFKVTGKTRKRRDGWENRDGRAVCDKSQKLRWEA